MRQQMLKTGLVEITAVVDVDVVDEPIVAAFPGVPADALLEEKARYPGVYGADDRWRLRVRAWLVRHPGGLLLMDTGVGGPWSLTQAWCSSPGALIDVLREQGVQPGDVDTVALSHVHDDHIGGTADANGEPMFANARYLLQRADRDWQRDLAREDEDDREFWDAFLEPIEHAGAMQVLDGDTRLSEHLELRHAPGHTPGHQVLRVASEGSRALLSADTFNHPAQLDHPDWPSGSDDDPAAAIATRRAILAELASHPETVLAPTHFAESFGRVGSTDDAVVWEAVEP